MPDIAIFALFFAVGLVTLHVINRRGNMRAFVAYLIVFTLFSAYMLIYAGNSFMIKLITPVCEGGKWILASQVAPFVAVQPYITLSFVLLTAFSLFVTASALWSLIKVFDTIKTGIKNGRHYRFGGDTRDRYHLKSVYCRLCCVNIYSFCRLNC